MSDEINIYIETLSALLLPQYEKADLFSSNEENSRISLQEPLWWEYYTLGKAHGSECRHREQVRRSLLDRRSSEAEKDAGEPVLHRYSYALDRQWPKSVFRGRKGLIFDKKPSERSE